jgi:hypothetical protein
MQDNANPVPLVFDGLVSRPSGIDVAIDAPTDYGEHISPITHRFEFPFPQSPQAATFPNGVMNENMRNPESILQFQAGKHSSLSD